jgi:hypothetical protein
VHRADCTRFSDTASCVSRGLFYRIRNQVLDKR